MLQHVSALNAGHLQTAFLSVCSLLEIPHMIKIIVMMIKC